MTQHHKVSAEWLEGSGERPERLESFCPLKPLHQCAHARECGERRSLSLQCACLASRPAFIPCFARLRRQPSRPLLPSSCRHLLTNCLVLHLERTSQLPGTNLLLPSSLSSTAIGRTTTLLLRNSTTKATSTTILTPTRLLLKTLDYPPPS
jgi:hypothetical protein